MNTFKNFAFNEKVKTTLDQLGFVEPTEIQKQAIPLLLEKRPTDFHGQAQTGTGKTLAFGLPLVHRIDVNNKATQALVVAPTRELAVQICDSIKPFAQAMGISFKAIYGGASMEEQVRALKQGVQIVVGTPGRINDHLRRGIMKLDQLQTLVLDEADIMLDMGFKEEVDEIIRMARREREIWLFSATVKSGIRSLMHEHMKNTISVSVSKQNVSTKTVKQYYCIIPQKARLAALCRFMETAGEFYGFIFCQTKLLTSDVADSLRRRGYQVGCLHGDMSQDQRNAVIKKFKAREYSIVVATDVAARGLDIQDLTHVVNFSLPEDHESYVHRTGRTGRAGKEGIAITFINKHDVRTVGMIQRKFNIVVEPITVPTRDEIVAKRMQQAFVYLERLTTVSDVAATSQQVTELVHKFSEEELRSLVTRLVQEKYLDSIMNEDEALFKPATSTSAGDFGRQNPEMMCAVGTDDGVERQIVIDFLVGTGVVTAEQIYKVRVLRRRTFIELSGEVIAQVIEELRGANLAGRPVRAQLVDERDSFEGGRRSNGGGRRSGGRDDRREGGRRDGRRSNASNSNRSGGSFMRRDGYRSESAYRG